MLDSSILGSRLSIVHMHSFVHKLYIHTHLHRECDLSCDFLEREDVRIFMHTPDHACAEAPSDRKV